jgi:phosphoribosylformimino-5-aminoimidazole carboxamide ribotide isomerase
MLVIPSISISEGKCAKLSANSNYKNAQLFEQSPLDLAMYFEDHGVQWVHFVDLDGARNEGIKNNHILEIIAKYTKLKINYSGGIRTDGDIQEVLDSGAKTITAATVAATDPAQFATWIITYTPNKIILGADMVDGHIATKGWSKKTEINYLDHITHWHNRGIQFIKVTDVSRDGVMMGPNFEMYQEVRDKFPNVQLVASGGVRSVEDIQRLSEMGLFAVIIARAFYEDKLTMKDLAKFF